MITIKNIINGTYFYDHLVSDFVKQIFYSIYLPFFILFLDNKKLPGKGPGAEDESLGTFNFLNSTKRRNEEIEDLTNNMSFTEIKNFYPSPRLTSPIYDYVTMDEFKKQVDIDNNPNIIKKGNNNQEALFIRRQFTFPAMLNQNYAQSARQLSDINSSKLKCNSGKYANYGISLLHREVYNY